jgi:hypothetical protein
LQKQCLGPHMEGKSRCPMCVDMSSRGVAPSLLCSTGLLCTTLERQASQTHVLCDELWSCPWHNHAACYGRAYMDDATDSAPWHAMLHFCDAAAADVAHRTCDVAALLSCALCSRCRWWMPVGNAPLSWPGTRLTQMNLDIKLLLNTRTAHVHSSRFLLSTSSRPRPLHFQWPRVHVWCTCMARYLLYSVRFLDASFPIDPSACELPASYRHRNKINIIYYLLNK